MFAWAHRQGYGVADGLVESPIGALPVHCRPVTVRHEVLDVSHLVVYSLEVVHVNLRAHFYSSKNKATENNWSLNWCHIVHVNFELIIIEQI